MTEFIFTVLYLLLKDETSRHVVNTSFAFLMPSTGYFFVVIYFGIDYFLTTTTISLWFVFSALVGSFILPKEIVLPIEQPNEINQTEETEETEEIISENIEEHVPVLNAI